MKKKEKEGKKEKKKREGKEMEIGHGRSLKNNCSETGLRIAKRKIEPLSSKKKIYQQYVVQFSIEERARRKEQVGLWLCEEGGKSSR